MIWMSIKFLCCATICIYAFNSFVLSVRNKKYQKIWYEEKALHIRVNPTIKKADLVDYYLMFCKRNDCRVDF